MATTTTLDTLVINYLTQAQYDAAQQAGTLNANQLYLTPDTGSSGGGGTLSSVGISNATNGGLSVSGSPLTSDGSITIGHSNVLTSAQTTQAVYPIAIDKNGHVSSYGSAVTINPKTTWYGTSSTGATTQAKTVTCSGFTLETGAIVCVTFSNANTYASAKITLNVNSTGAKDVYYNNAVTSSTNTLLWKAGETVIFVYSGSYYYFAGKSANKLSAFVNDSGFITSADVPEGSSAYTGTISAVSTTASSGSNNGFARGDHVHNITSSTITSALGYTPGTSSTDENVKSTTVTAASTMYLVGSSSSSTTTGGVNKHASINAYVTADSGTSGYARITIGNSTASGTAGAKYGYLRLYGDTANYIDLRTESGYPTGTRTIYLPSYDNSMYLTCTSTTNAVGGATTAPVYVDADGRIQAVTSIPYSLLTSTPTIPSITLNGSSSTSPSFYAPTSAGTSGYYLKSNGSGAPTWNSLLDTFYPVGSYYITSDSNFNPNTSWGGTWTKIDEGQVILSAGTNYIAGSSYGSNTHTLTSSEIGVPAHGHGFTNPKIPNHVHTINHGHSNTFKLTIVHPDNTGSLSTSQVVYGRPTGTSYTNANSLSGGVSDYSGNSGNPTSLNSTTNGSVTDHAGTSPTSALSLMQKSVASYIWHRTA